MIAEPVLVTGAAGFLGRHLTRQLIERGLEVRVMVRPGHDTSHLEASGAAVIRGDVAEPSQVREALLGCGTVFHLAAARGPSKLPRRAYLELNRRQAETVGQAAALARVKRLVYTSAAVIAGAGNGKPVDEASSPSPSSGYRESRLLAEGVLLDLARRHGLRVVIARLPSVMGPGAVDWRSDFLKVGTGRLRYLPSGGVTHIGDVDDMIQGVSLCADVPGVEGERFILAAAEPVKVRDLYLAIANALGVPLAIREVPGAPFRAYAQVASLVYRATGRALPHGFTCERLAARRRFRIEKARAVLGFTPRWDLPATVARTAAWMREIGWFPVEARENR